MTGRAHLTFICIACVIAAGTLLSIYSRYNEITNRLSFLEVSYTRQTEEPVITTYWESGGQTRSWSSTQRPGETMAQLIARHNKEVAEAQELLPPDP